MKILVTSVSTDIISDEVRYNPLLITDNLQDAIDYIKKSGFSKYLLVDKYALFTLRDEDKATVYSIDNKIFID